MVNRKSHDNIIDVSLRIPTTETVKSCVKAEKCTSGNIIPIVFCADAHYGTYLPVVIQSVIDHSSPDHHYHIIILDCGIDKEMSYCISEQLVSLSNFSCEFKDIKNFLDKYKKHFFERLHYTATMYARLFIPQLCQEYEKIIYSDIDVIFERDIAELLKIDLGRNCIAAVTELAVEFERTDGRIKEYTEKVLHLEEKIACIYSGLLVFNRKIWCEQQLTEKLMQFLAGKKLRCPDQDALVAVSKGNITYLGQEWTCVILKERIERLVQKARTAKLSSPKLEALLQDWQKSCKSGKSVIHYNGSVKPWHYPYVFLGEKWWYYAAKTSLYSHYNHMMVRKMMQMDFPTKSYNFLGIPLIRIKKTPREKKYLFCGLRVAKKEYGKKDCSIYILGIKLFSVYGDG